LCNPSEERLKMAEEIAQATGVVLPTESGHATESTAAKAVLEAPASEPLVDAELLVEDVSIDGMCGVY